MHVIDGGILTGGTEIVGKNDSGLGEELAPPGCVGPGRLAGLQRRAGELREAGLRMDFHHAEPGLAYLPVDLKDLGLQGERLA